MNEYKSEGNRTRYTDSYLTPDYLNIYTRKYVSILTHFVSLSHTHHPFMCFDTQAFLLSLYLSQRSVPACDAPKYFAR